MSKKTVLTLVATAAVALAAGAWWGKSISGGGSAGLSQSVSAASLLANKASGADAGTSALLKAGGGGKLITVKAGESIQDAVHKAEPGDTIQVMPGTYKETVYIDKDNISLYGVIKDNQWPLLEGEHKLNDAVLYSGNGVRVENLKIMNFKGNAIMGQAGNNFVIRNNWIINSGVYGIFPEFGKNGLIEHNVLSGIEDAAIYVGMCDNIMVSHNEVFASVAGIEIENTRHAIVEGNLAYDNAGGIMTFITPGLPIKTTQDVIIRNNFISGNNHKNFGAPGSMVSGLPSGSGVVVMAAKDVVIENNIIRDNKNAGIIVVDHKSFANVTLDPETDPAPSRVQILDNLMTDNGTDPVKEIKALKLASLQTHDVDIVAAGEGHDNCVLHKERYATAGLSSFGVCTRASTADIVSYLLPQPAEARAIDIKEKGKLTYLAVCAGCHAYNARMIGPPVLVIQQLYDGNAQGIADYIAKAPKKREDFPAMPPQDYLNAEIRKSVAEYMLTVKK